MNQRLAYLTIGTFSVLLCAALFSIDQLQFGYKLENFFSKGNSEYTFYKDYKKQFGNDNNFLMVAVDKRSDVFEANFLSKITTVSQKLQKVKGIEQVISPTLIRQKIKVPFFGINERPLIDRASTKSIEASKRRLVARENAYSHLFGADGNALLLYLVIEDDLTKKQTKSLLARIKETMAPVTSGSNARIHYAGQMNTRVYYISALEREVLLFSSLTLILLVVFLIITYRSTFAIVSTLLVLIASIIFTFAIIEFYLGELDFLMTMLPTLLFVIGISNTIHFLASYKEQLQKNEVQTRALLLTIRETGSATFVSAFTTALGFFALYFLPSPPIQNFGIFSGIGILICWVVSITLLPALIAITRRFAVKKRSEVAWESWLEKGIFSVLKRKKQIMVLSVVLILGGLFGLGFIRSNSHFLDDLSAKSELKTDLNYFENQFGGIRPFELSVKIPKNTKGSLFTLERIRALNEVERFLSKEYGVSMIHSTNTVLKEVNVFQHAGNSEFYELPTSAVELEKLTKIMKKYRVNKKIGHIVDADFTSARITGKLKDLGSNEMKIRNKKLAEFVSKHDQTLSFKLTGAAHLMDKTNESISSDLLTGLIFSLLIVTLIISILLRSFLIALLSLIPNILPLLLIAGILGLFGIDLKIATALIFPVIFGIAVDDTIHFLMRYRSEYKLDPSSALINTYKYTGKKLILTSFILSSGFVAFTLSEFSSTMNAGFLISFGLIIALLSDLLILPLLIHSIEKKHIFRKV